MTELLDFRFNVCFIAIAQKSSNKNVISIYIHKEHLCDNNYYLTTASLVVTAQGDQKS